MLLNFLLKILFFPVRALNNWSDKQQWIYEEYQSEFAMTERQRWLFVKRMEAELAENVRIARRRERRPDLSRI